jgi:DNA-binding response OmpR family regulator
MNAVAEDVTGFRPCLILAHADPAYTAQAARAFRRHGWDVYPARNGPEVRRLARMLEPQLVVLQADLPEESGWLTCDKLTGESPTCKVVLVVSDLAPVHAAFASFVGASACVDRGDGAAALLARVREPALPAVG